MSAQVAKVVGGARAPKVVSREEWLAARKELLAEEKKLTRQLDALSARRRQLPWVKLEKTYTFEGPTGKVTLGDLFRGRSQLLVQHIMFAPGDEEACVGCSFSADHVDGARVHFEARDLAFAGVSRAPWQQIETYKKRMGWRFAWVSSLESDFNYDFGVSFTPEHLKNGTALYNYDKPVDAPGELPGYSVFAKDASGQLYHTYSTYSRGGDILLGTHNFLDLTPKGRNESHEDGTDRLRRHDRYEEAGGESCCGSEPRP